MTKSLIFLITLFFSLSIYCQTEPPKFRETAPKNGDAGLASVFFEIDFTDEQRNRFSEREIELYFKISAQGIPTLNHVKGIKDQGILDSLTNTSRTLEPFHPKRRYNKSKPAVYYLYLVLPDCKVDDLKTALRVTHKMEDLRIEDFEYFHKSNKQVDFLLSWAGNLPLGGGANYLNYGGGLRSAFSCTSKNKYVFGMSAGIYHNPIIGEFALNEQVQKSKYAVSRYLGLSFGKRFDNLLVQLNADWLSQKVTQEIVNPNLWIRNRGVNSGIVFNYFMPIGRERPMIEYDSSALLQHNLNIHLALKALYGQISQANGLMVEFGFGYRLSYAYLQDYKLKSLLN